MKKIKVIILNCVSNVLNGFLNGLSALRQPCPLRVLCTLLVLCALHVLRISHALHTLHAIVYCTPALRVFNLDLFYRERIQLHKQYSQQPNQMLK